MSKRKRIYNPKTRKYYKIQQRDGEVKRGQIAGSWKPKSKPKKKKGFFEKIFK